MPCLWWSLLETAQKSLSFCLLPPESSMPVFYACLPKLRLQWEVRIFRNALGGNITVNTHCTKSEWQDGNVLYVNGHYRFRSIWENSNHALQCCHTLKRCCTEVCTWLQSTEWREKKYLPIIFDTAWGFSRRPMVRSVEKCVRHDSPSCGSTEGHKGWLLP